MGATIYKAPLKPGEVLHVGERSRFVEAMTAAFGAPPWEIRPCHLDVLRGMSAAGLEPDVLATIADGMITTHPHGVRIWPEY
jgi:hypothetical protein